ncbi:MAG: T9SS type A sorting domain-containing protein [Candidatus Latescibacteria bacterium]|nr:T9SS type A sorting domain-containing protein [Candidatus Latescibacterota bacterium]
MMKTVKGLAAGLLVLLLALPVLADATRLPLGEDATRLELLSRVGDAYHYRLSLDGLAAERVMTPQGAFTRLEIPGYYHSQDVGAPALPLVNRLIEIPFGARAQVSVIDVRERTVDLAASGFGDPLLPAQASVSKSMDPAMAPFAYDADAYRVDPVARDLVRVVDCGQLRGVHVGRLEISPVSYSPEGGSLRVAESVEFTVDFAGGDPVAEARLKALTRSPFFTPVYERIEGVRGLHDSYPDHVRDLVTLVVVTPPEFENQLADFVAWKERRGFKTILAVTGTPEVGSTKEQIRDYIHGLYNNATPELPAPSFVIFVGDIAQMPTFTEGGDVTDRPYCAVDGDLYPDIYYGRFSATNPTQLQNILDKTLMYDQYAMPDPSYLDEVVMIAGMDGSFGSTWANGQINYGTTYYFNAAHNILSHTYLYPNSGSHAADIVQDVSNGVSYVNYTAHGSTTSWSDPSFTQSNINSLQNSGKYCLAVGNCCLTSSYEVAECFAETWLRVADKGAIGYIGGSNSTYWDEDYWWGVGYGSIVANPTYETHEIGAYDGLFHDHGEAMTQWYVTNDALIYTGNLAVTEAGSNLISYYWTIYNLMGDPSLSTWIGTPGTNPVSHDATLFTTSASMSISALPNSYCALSQNGVLKGAGTVDATGTLDMEIWELLTPGTAECIVMAQNKVPHVETVNIAVPATIVFDPATIDAGVPTDVTVGVYEADGVTPKPGIEVWADGIGYATAHSTTGVDGTCVLSLDYPYGPSLDICGQDPAETYLLFRQALPVNALAQSGIALRVNTDIGLNGAFPLNLPGTLEAYKPFGGALPAHELWAYVNDEPGLMSTADALTLTPNALGSVRGVFAQVGYDCVEATFPIIEAFGTLTGHVDADGSPAAGALVQGWDGGAQPAFEAVCNASGDYDMGEDILVADYTLTVTLFGFEPFSEALFVGYGPNVHDVDLLPAPSGLLTGTITEAGSGAPLGATVRIFRSDTGELYEELSSSPTTGAYASGALPYFDWDVTVRASGHIPESATITVDAPAVTRDFVLEETVGNILIIDDGAKSTWHEAKLDLAGNVIEAGYEDAPKDIATLQGDLEGLGYTVIVETMSSNPSTWFDYDFIMTCSGNNTTTLDNATFRAALLSFVQAGGKLLVEGGEVGYDWDYQDSAWAQAVLHVANWNHDSSGSVTVYDANHPVMSFPNAITGPITVSYSGYGDQDALVVTADAERIGAWTSYPTDASIIVCDRDATPEDGDFVMFGWCYASMDAAKRVQLLENAVVWLIGGGLTPVEEAPVTLPTQVALRGNFPNPFNPKTSIRFELPATAQVELAVYDVKGRRVATLVDGTLIAGPHVVEWQGREASGAQATSGVYFARLKVGDEVLTRKMLLLK